MSITEIQIVTGKSGMSRLTLVELKMLVTLIQATPQGLCPYLVRGSPNSSIIDVSMSSYRNSKAEKKCDGLHVAIFGL